MLGDAQRDTLFFYLDVISLVLAESHDLLLLDSLHDQVNVALARLERDFPIAIQVIHNKNYALL